MGKRPAILAVILAWFLSPPGWSREAPEPQAGEPPRTTSESHGVADAPADAVTSAPADTAAPNAPPADAVTSAPADTAAPNAPPVDGATPDAADIPPPVESSAPDAADIPAPADSAAADAADITAPADADAPDDTPAGLPHAPDAGQTAAGSKTVLGPRNPDLYEGAQKLLYGDGALGVELTLRGLKVAVGPREVEAALSNLCAGYIMLERYDEALGYCESLLTRNDKNWRGYNNRAVIYIKTGQYEKAHNDLLKGEALNPGARTLRIARAMYLDAVKPVEPKVEIDDRQLDDDEDGGE